MTEIQKIKDLFNSSDISNHKLAYILAKSQLGMNDKEICSMVLNDGGGWKDYYTECFSIEKHIFNGRIESLRRGGSMDDIRIDLFINKLRYDSFWTNKVKLGKRIKYVNDWFSKLDK